MRLGFSDAEELRARHAAFQRHRLDEREAFERQIGGAHRAVDASWETLKRSKAMVEEADRFGRAREINILADDLLAQQRELIAMHDDGAILAAIFPKRTAR